MKKSKIKFISLVSILVLLEFASVFLMYKSSTVQETKLDDVRLRETSNKNNTFAIMLEQSDGTYSASDSNTWPTDMKFNSDKSGCIDANGNKIDGALTYDSTNNIATVETGDTTYCYLYFDIMPKLSELCSEGDNLGSCLTTNNSEITSLNDNVEGGLYRYQGTNDTVNNYVCFGTTDSSECTSNTDAYMYRIIGVNESGQLKLIKKEALNSTMTWNSSTGVTWPNSGAYSSLNGSTFYTNTTYVPTSWQSKIAETSWKYGDITTINTTASAVYTTENGWSSTVSNYIGLMYMHDYYYAYQSGGLNCSDSGDYTTCKTSWLHLSVNDSGAPIPAEWTLSRYNSTYAWGVLSDGRVADAYMSSNSYSVRPVFYLNADEVYISGDGTLDNPIMLSEPPKPIGEYLLTNPSSGLDTTTQYGGLYRYQGTTADNYICFGYSDYETDCDFTNTTNSDLYAYRIIGINESGQLKLIKKEALNTAYAWNSSTGVTWPQSELYLKLNLGYFYSNTTYVPDTWEEKIAKTSWKYGDTTYTHSYNGLTAYNTEQAWTSYTNNYIGLMYQSDYLLAYQGGNPGSYSNAKTAWIHLSANDSGAPSTSEWLLSRYDSNLAWNVGINGHLAYDSMTDTYSVRPVFYLTSDVQFVSGTGASTDPFIIQ